MPRDVIRRVRFAPYRPGAGPRFALTMWATPRTDWRGQTVLGYRLRMGRRTLFEGEDFAGSPLDADDSDASVRSLMGFLTLRPGDTDAEYFTSYTDAQRAYCDEHAESLAYEVFARFGEDR